MSTWRRLRRYVPGFVLNIVGLLLGGSPVPLRRARAGRSRRRDQLDRTAQRSGAD